jgi:hypothetical protein
MTKLNKIRIELLDVLYNWPNALISIVLSYYTLQFEESSFNFETNDVSCIIPLTNNRYATGHNNGMVRIWQHDNKIIKIPNSLRFSKQKMYDCFYKITVMCQIDEYSIICGMKNNPAWFLILHFKDNNITHDIIKRNKDQWHNNIIISLQSDLIAYTTKSLEFITFNTNTYISQVYKFDEVISDMVSINNSMIIISTKSNQGTISEIDIKELNKHNIKNTLHLKQIYELKKVISIGNNNIATIETICINPNYIDVIVIRNIKELTPICIINNNYEKITDLISVGDNHIVFLVGSTILIYDITNELYVQNIYINNAKSLVNLNNGRFAVICFEYSQEYTTDSKTIIYE